MFENVQRIMNRIDQLESRINQKAPPEDSSAFQRLFQEAGGAPPTQRQPPLPGPQLPSSLGQLQGLNPQLWSMLRQGSGYDASHFGSARQGALDLVPQAQNNSVSCGQTSVAMAVNALTGKRLQDSDIDQRYGFELLNALNSESAPAGYQWKDGGEIHAGAWELIDHKVNQEKTPVIVALNGPEFSPSGRGHIVTLIKTEGETVTYADPADGRVKTTTKSAMNAAPSHPDGNFIFYANRDLSGGNYVAGR